MTEARAAAFSDDALVSGSETARDSLTVAAWTMVSRLSGVVRVVVIGAVLGPTSFGDAYQLTNVVPNLLFYGFLAGSLLSSLLVPALVRHIDRAEDHETARISGGFLGVLWVALLVAAPIAILVLPWLVETAARGQADIAAGQVRLFVVLALPQVFMYAVIASATAVMFASRKYLLAAAAPAIENVGIVLVLLVTAGVFGTDYRDAGSVPDSVLWLLGIGSTVAVVVHALVQWLGARSQGVTLLPRAGWRDPDVRRVVARAMWAIGQSGLLALQVLMLLALAGRVAGGTVAMQIALNFYHVPLALAAAPVGLAVLPRLARLHGGASTDFSDAYHRALTLALFLIVPAAAGYVLLARELGNSIAAGAMSADGGAGLVSACLVGLALGMVGETVFVVSTQAAYARHDAVSPVRAMAVQTVACACLFLVAAVLLDGTTMLVVLGGGLALASAAGGGYLLVRVSKAAGPTTLRPWPSVLRILVATAVMSVVVRAVVALAVHLLNGRAEALGAVLLGALAGAGTYLVVHVLLRTPELGWLRDAVRPRRVAVEEVTG